MKPRSFLSFPTPPFLLLLLLQGPRIHILGYTTCIVADLGVHTSMVVLIHEFWVQYSLVVAVVLTHMGAWDYIQELSAHTSSVTVLLKALNPSLSLTSFTHLLQLQGLPDSSITTILNTCDVWVVLEITRIDLHVHSRHFQLWGVLKKKCYSTRWLLLTTYHIMEESERNQERKFVKYKGTNTSRDLENYLSRN